ncbi:TPA: hypothetical protein N0F65_003727 [Lagenidium giganteum]|uniref:Uncharacterized protein n=1 Tax=Lagenidium giganteum TaxID=4803 RepID=A0AAV2Z173_9STRA|nr:TPA: hypothetical protein N0F65_003727 [Lagenidium giganteum]
MSQDPASRARPHPDQANDHPHGQQERHRHCQERWLQCQGQTRGHSVPYYCSVPSSSNTSSRQSRFQRLRLRTSSPTRSHSRHGGGMGSR